LNKTSASAKAAAVGAVCNRDRRRLAFLLLALVLAWPALATPPARVLFIGNSYTGVNNLPAIFKEIVASAGAPVPHIEAATPGGRMLHQHLNLPGTLEKIDKGNWDIVVVQGHSQEAALSEQSAGSRSNFLTGAAGLYDRIKAKSPNAKIVFYETWARHADYWKNPKNSAAVGRDPADMQARIRTWYRHVASKPDTSVAPVGDAWELNYHDPQAVRLHATDNSHPAFNGSYLAGLVIYATIYQPANLAIAYHGKLTEPEAARLQRLAQQAVRGK
jgi:hypothetical protein